MYLVYSLLLFLSMLFYIPAYFVRLRLKRGQPLALWHRLGFKVPESRRDNRPSIWIHAVSVGEVLSLQHLLAVIRERHPDWRIYLSTLTTTGMQVAREKLSAVDELFFIPLDFKWSVSRYFRALKPRLFVLAESEFWPNLLRSAGKQCRSVILVNGRISPRSAKRYSRIRPLINRVLESVDLFMVQTGKDGKRLAGMGIGPDRIEVAGNLKADVRLPELSEEEVSRIRAELGLDGGVRIIVAGSTHRGEEAALLDAFAAAKQRESSLRLILAPRHVSRAAEVDKICRDLGLSFRRRTDPTAGSAFEVMILDTIGELARLYAVSDQTFLGGSLVPWGGQNFLEPAYYGKPVFFGPYMHNFEDLAELFIEEGAAKIISSREDLIRMFLAEDRMELSQMGKRGRELLFSLQGATERTLRIFEAKVDLE
jgi:3-deoxy-D-manno-octulosonic-acid transferase